MGKSAKGLYIMIITILPIISFAQGWVSRYNGPGNSEDVAYAIAVDGVGNVYVTGRSYGSGTGFDYATIKYDSFGMEQWVARYNGPGNYHDMAYAIAIDAVDNICVTGWSDGLDTSSDYTTIKYDSLGVEQWVMRYNGPGNGTDVANALTLDAGGNVYVTGYSDGGLGTYYDYATIKYNSSGVEQWIARYDGPRSEYDLANAIAVNSVGNVYVTGRSDGIGTAYDYATIKYDSLGVEQWVARYDDGSNWCDEANAIAVDGVGNVYVTGRSGTSRDYATIRYDSLGTEQWVAWYNGPANYVDGACAMALDTAANIYVTGFSNGLGRDYATIKYDSSGVEQWVARYNGPGNQHDEAFAIAVDIAGNSYVTGYSHGGSGTDYDYATVRYDTWGVERAVVRYDGPTHNDDFAFAIAVNNQDNVYVTGKSYDTYWDYATIRYSPLEVEEMIECYDQAIRLHISPNPFRNATKIEYQITGDRSLTDISPTFVIYDATGRLVKNLQRYEIRDARYIHINWLGDDNDGNKLPSAVYFLEANAGEWSTIEKLLLIK
jgi:hypothetical protein